MATNAPSKDELIHQKLETLFELQTQYSHLDDIDILQGELPIEIEDLEDEIAGLHTRLDKKEDELDEARKAISENSAKIEESKANIEKYKEQIKNVRNSREYDSLSKEIEFQGLEIELAEKKKNQGESDVDTKTFELKNLSVLVTDKEEHLASKKAELNTIIEGTEKDRGKLERKIKRLEKDIEPRLLSGFNRIRRNVRNGLAVVTVKRHACGGCFNKVSPQMRLDIKLMSKLIVCEYCGRIIVADEIAGITPEEVEEKPKKKVRRKKRTQEKEENEA